MPDAAYPYATHLNVLHAPLEVVDLQPLIDACADRWYNQTLCRVNDSVVRLGVMQGEYHWHKHDEEDEFLYVISGEATVIEEDGAHLLQPGDAACWPAGTANAHQVVNQSRAPCSYLIFGTGAVPDIVHYPERGEILYAFEDGSWRLQRTDGALIKEGNPD